MVIGRSDQNHQAADEIAGDVLQTKADAYPHGAGENRECSKMNSGVLQDDEDSNHQHDVADDLGDGVLQGAI